MGILDAMRNKIMNKEPSFDHPVFIKEFEKKNDVILALEKLLKEPDKYDEKKVNIDLKLFNEGMMGEEKIAFELTNSHMPILVIHNLQCKFNNLSAQIDYVIISQAFILAVECKNMIGDLEITNEGEFVRHYKNASGKYYKKEGMYSPITQNDRHAYLLMDILNDMNIIKPSEVKDLVISKIVISNPKTYINKKFAPKRIKEKIIRADQIIETLHNLNEEKKSVLSEENMKLIAYKLLTYQNFDKVPINVEKYKITNEVKTKQYSKDNYKQFKKAEIKPKNVEYKQESKVQPSVNEDNSIEKEPLYLELKQYRTNKSKEEKNKPYMVFNNNTLEQIVREKPVSKDALLKIRGISTVKYDRYGADIIGIVSKFK